jgi:hypothetical protein
MWPRSRSCRFDFQTAKQCQAYNRDLAARCARVLHEFSALFKQRAWGMPGARRTRSLVCAWGSEYAHEYSQRGRQNHPASPRNGLRLMARSPRRSGFVASVAGENDFAKLDAGVEASGPHVFAVRFSAVRRRHIRVHRIPPRVRDDREPPLRWDETTEICEVIWVGREEEIFFQKGLDRNPVICPSGNFRDYPRTRHDADMPKLTRLIHTGSRLLPSN